MKQVKRSAADLVVVPVPIDPVLMPDLVALLAMTWPRLIRRVVGRRHDLHGRMRAAHVFLPSALQFPGAGDEARAGRSTTSRAS